MHAPSVALDSTPSELASSAGWDPKFLQFGSHILSRLGWANIPIDKQNVAVLTNIKSVALGVHPEAENLVVARGLFSRIAEQRKVGLIRVGKFAIFFDWIDAGHKIGDLEPL